MFKDSPITKISLDDREFYVKRDDLIDPFLAGNKYRKLYTLLQSPSSKFNKIISYGGTQSNAMLAIAKMAQLKGWEFVYYTKPISETLKNKTTGNLFNALSLGMKHIEIELDRYKEFIASMRFNLDDKTYIIDQGGADKSATDGLKVLADEILLESLEIDAIATPSGTGTTALFLALNLPEHKIYTVACIGGSEYLKEQMSALAPIPKNLIILEPKKKYHFAKLYPEFLEIYKKTLDAGVEFDLLYAPSMWLSLLDISDEKILYVHSGGVSGNTTMLERYKRSRF